MSAVLYTDVELESYIPAGWSLADAERGWDEKKKAFRCVVVDTSDLDWELLVPGRAVADRGRIPALRDAVDRLFRERFKSILG